MNPLEHSAAGWEVHQKVAGQILIAAGGWHDDTPGGAYRLPSDFAQYLARQGERVAYLCPSRLKVHADSEYCKGVELHRYFVDVSSAHSTSKLLAHIQRTRAIAARVASRGKIKVLLGHAPLQYLGSLLGCRPERKVYSVHSPFASEMRSNWSDRPSLMMRAASSVAGSIERYICSKSDVVQCFSDFVRTELQEKYGQALTNKLVVIPAWVDTNRFAPSSELPPQVRARLGMPWNADTTTFICVRRLVQRMGLDILLKAAAILSNEGFDFKLVVAGEGPQLEPLRNLSLTLGLQSRIAFVGRVAEEDLVEMFRAGDCFVLPTRSLEGFGLIILEAYACGTPVIAVPVGAIPDVMGASRQDWVALDNSAIALAQRMRDFLLRRLVADRGQLRRRALEFDFCYMAAQHQRVLLQVETAPIASLQ